MDIVNRYRDSHNLSSDDDSEDSDKECNVWKRATVKKVNEDEILQNTEVEEEKPPPIQEKPTLKRKRNTVWCEVLQDQLISEDLEDCLLKNKPRNYGSRGKESYDYTLRYNDQRSDIDSESYMSDSTMNDDEPKSKKQCSSSTYNRFKKFVKLNGAELTAARKINKVLNEKKFYLIQRIVKTVGIEKSMKLLSMTEEIEENGGMMIKSNTRRRTPGGVYIQLLKNDKDITQEMLDEIFDGEMSGLELKKYYAERKKNKKMKSKRRQNKHNHPESKNMADSSSNLMEHDEMDADVTANKSPEISKENLENISSVPAIENDSDLEEGEIED